MVVVFGFVGTIDVVIFVFEIVVFVVGVVVSGLIVIFVVVVFVEVVVFEIVAVVNWVEFVGIIMLDFGKIGNWRRCRIQVGSYRRHYRKLKFIWAVLNYEGCTLVGILLVILQESVC